MSGDTEDRGLVKEYLLGELTDQERERFEVRMMSDTELFNEMLLVEEDLVEAYVHGTMSRNERQRFELSYMSTVEGREQVNFARALGKYVNSRAANNAHSAKAGKERRPIFARSTWFSQLARSPYLRGAAAAVIVIGLGLGIWRTFFYQSDLSKGLGLLAYAYRDQRPTEARISGFNYAPLSNTRGAQPARVDDFTLNSAERILLDEVSKHSSSPAHHALGRLYFAEGKFEYAIKEFEEALKSDPNKALLHADYGALLFEQGKHDRQSDDSGKGFEELARSLEHLNKALELDSSLLEALFNRALVHQEMMLTQQAEEDWQQYLENDPNSGWADEARRNLNLLYERKQKTSQTKEETLQDFLSAEDSRDDDKAWKVVSQSREAVSGKLIWEQLLDAYLEASARDEQAHASNNLKALSYLGELEAQRAGDLYTARLAQFYKSSSAVQRKKLAQARSQMKMGHQYYALATPLRALDAFGEARRLFAEIGNEPEALYAQQWIAFSHLERGSTHQGVSLLEQLAPAFERKNFKWLLMRTLQSLCGAQYSIYQYSKGIDYGRRALTLAQGMDDKVGIFNTLSLLTEAYRYMANYRQSLSCGEHSLAIMDSSFLSQIQISRHYHILASAFMACSLPAAAIGCEKEALRRTLTTGHPQMISLVYAQLGAMYGRAGRSPEALINTELAYETAKSLSDERVRTKMMANSSLQMGHLHREAGEFDKAIISYDECIKLYTLLDLHYDLYEACKGKLLCCISQTNDLVARQELDRTLNIFEKYRPGILGEEDRNRYFDVEQSVYDIAIDFEYARENQPRKAFEQSEQSRARSLLDSVTGHTRMSYVNGEPDIISESISRPLELATIRRRLPERVQIVQYAVLSDKLLIWIVSRTGFSTVEKKIAQRDLNQKVIDYLHCVSGPADCNKQKMKDDAKDLFDILITPVNPLLDSKKPLYIVPDKVLNYLPFGALVSPDSDRYLLEDYPLIISPSSSLLVICSGIASRKEGERVEKLLAVGNPRFDSKAFPSLRDLPSAAREAEGVAAYYSTPRLLLGEDAREERVKSEMARSDVIHFALHSEIDLKSPMQSKLVLTREPKNAGARDGTDGVLQAHEIYRLKLPQTRVVILSACQTAVERYYEGEGMIGMARPFMAAGVPVVVVTLWPVDSDATAELMISFHKHRRLDKVSTAEALRLAQLDMLGSSNERFHQPYYWAPFIIVGGSASF